MKWSFLFYSALMVSLLGCQGRPAFFSFSDKERSRTPDSVVFNYEQIVEYGVKFASDYDVAPKTTCAKFKKLYQQGDWRAGWVLALHVPESESKKCLNITEAVQILTTLESEKKIDPDLIWLNQYHLRLLHKLQQQTKEVSQLKSTMLNNKQQLVDLQNENQDLVEKLEALKAIETSIIQ